MTFFPRGLSNWNLSNLTSRYGFSLVSFLRKNTNFCLDLISTSRRRPALNWENGCWTSLRFTQISTSPDLNYCNPDQFDLDLTSLPLPLVQPALERGALHKHKWDGTAVIKLQTNSWPQNSDACWTDSKGIVGLQFFLIDFLKSALTLRPKSKR